MKPGGWFVLALAVVALFAGLSRGAVGASSADMPTLAKKPATRKKSVARLRPIPSAVDSKDRLRPGYAVGFASIRPGADLTKPTPLPAPKGTTTSLLRKVRAGEFAKGVEIGRVIAAVESRSSRRL